MEKYSAYRDPGTGIQPFLTPVPPIGSDILAKALSPLSYALALVRTILVLVLAAVYVLLVNVILLLLRPISPLHRLLSRLFTALIARLALLILGLFWIPVQLTSRKRGRAGQTKEPWSPRAGDIIVSNWASWIEVLWLAFRFNPIFLSPVAVRPPVDAVESSTPITNTGRRTGTGSANVASGKTRKPSPRVPIKGFRETSLLQMLRFTGRIVPTLDIETTDYKSLEEWTKTAQRPLVIFPEGTTSNGRGILNFASVFKEQAPSRKFKVFVMCVRYDPPTNHTPSASHSIPSSFLNPLPHMFSLGTSLLAQPGISIRLLPPSEGPSNPLFLASEVLSSYDGDDQLAEACAALVAQTGKFKRTGMGWEDKNSFLEFYSSKKGSR